MFVNKSVKQTREGLRVWLTFIDAVARLQAGGLLFIGVGNADHKNKEVKNAF